MSEYDFSGLNILVADDYHPMRHILRGILREWRVSNVADVSNGQEAREKLKNSPADILFLDHKMAPVDGIELTKKIRAGDAGLDRFFDPDRRRRTLSVEGKDRRARQHRARGPQRGMARAC